MSRQSIYCCYQSIWSRVYAAFARIHQIILHHLIAATPTGASIADYV